MPRTARPCATCPNIIPADTTGPRCPDCKRQRTRRTNAQRRARGDHWYDDPNWRRTRTRTLTAHPTCQYCERAKSQVVDHVPPRRILKACGVHDPDHPRWLIAACERCHNTITARIDKKLVQSIGTTTTTTPEQLAELAYTLRAELVAELRRGGVGTLNHSDAGRGLRRLDGATSSEVRVVPR